MSEINKKLIKNNNVFLYEVKQKSKEWISLREKHITATDISFLMETVFHKKQFFGQSKLDFFNRKFGINQKPISVKGQEFIKSGNLMEEISAKRVDVLCDYLNNKYPNDDFLVKKAPVVTRDEWILSSLDYLIVKNGTPDIPVEIKHVNSPSIYKSMEDMDYYYYYQLAAQMYTINADKGVMIFYTDNSTETECVRILKKDSKFYKEFEGYIDVLKDIHKDVCIKKVKPFQNELDKLKQSAKTLIDLRNSDYIIAEKRNILEDNNKKKNIIKGDCSLLLDEENKLKEQAKKVEKELEVLNGKLNELEYERKDKEQLCLQYDDWNSKIEAEILRIKNLGDSSKLQEYRYMLGEDMHINGIYSFEDDNEIYKFTKCKVPSSNKYTVQIKVIDFEKEKEFKKGKNEENLNKNTKHGYSIAPNISFLYMFPALITFCYFVMWIRMFSYN